MILLVACLNGSRRKADAAAVPVTPAEVGAAAAACRDAGAREVHVHPRDADGAETLAPEHVAAAVRAVHKAAPGCPVSVTTNLTAEADPQRRLALVPQWLAPLADYASVNLCEPGSVELARALLRRGVQVEAGVWTPADVATLVDSGLAPRCARVLIEPMEHDAAAALANAAATLDALAHAAVRQPVLLHGTEGTTWPVLADAVARGLDTRVGLEDTLVLPDGAPAPDNAALVAAAAHRLRPI